MPSKNTVRADLNYLRKLCKSISLLQREKGDRPAVDEVSSPLKQQLKELTHKRNKILDKYHSAISALSPEESLIFTLYYRQGLTQKQVATKTNYCKSSITKHLSAIIDKLK